jgi:hypothetical protein
VRLIVDYSISRRLVDDYFASAARPGVSAHHAARHADRRAARRRLLRLAQAPSRLHRLRRAAGCLGTSRGSSRGSSRRSSSTASHHAGSSTTTSPTPRVRVPWHVGRLITRLVAPLLVDNSASRRLVVNYFAYVVRPGASARHAAHLEDRRAARRRLLCLARLVVDYFASDARSGASTRRTARCAAHRRLLHLAQARRRLHRLCLASGCLGTSRGSSRRSSSTTPHHAGSSTNTSPTPRVRVTRHVARLVTRLLAPLIVDNSASRRLVVDNFASAACSGASTRRAARCAAHRRLLRLAQARRRLLRLRRASSCFGTSRG